MHSDPIADMLNRIQNAVAVHHASVKVPYSQIKGQLADLLVQEGFLKGAERKKETVGKSLLLLLGYGENEAPIIHGLKRLSKPGKRMYIKAVEVHPVKNGYGRLIISTSKGLMTNKEAHKKQLGGEAMCMIW